MPLGTNSDVELRRGRRVFTNDALKAAGISPGAQLPGAPNEHIHLWSVRSEERK
jgi:hypothetical protein